MTLLSRDEWSVSTQPIADSLRDVHVERCVEDNQERMEQDAHRCRVDRRTFERQVRLHLPAVSPELLKRRTRACYEAVRDVALRRSVIIGDRVQEALSRANASLLLPKAFRTRRDLALFASDLSEIRLSFRQVKPSVGYYYQRRLHYLQSVRADTRLHFGIFLPGADFPLTYAALSVCDRPYISDSLVVSGLGCRREDCLVLTRMYGLPGIPKNLMSLTLRNVVQALRGSMAAKVVLTAYNPLLGFDGATFRASGFYPFATAPVGYRYDEFGEFTTRRTGKAVHRSAHVMPPNVLMLRGVDRTIQRKITDQVRLVTISDSDYQHRVSVDGRLPDFSADVWLKQLRSYRRQLQAAWSKDTVHPSYIDGFDLGSSRGQCGVTSVWLATELHSTYGVMSSYCYGDLTFDNPDLSPVQHHCWLEIGDGDDPSRLVIDLTCDQAEHISEPVLCAPHDKLIAQGLNYVSRSRLKLDQLPSDRVWHRYERLSDALYRPVESVGVAGYTDSD